LYHLVNRQTLACFLAEKLTPLLDPNPNRNPNLWPPVSIPCKPW